MSKILSMAAALGALLLCSQTALAAKVLKEKGQEVLISYEPRDGELTLDTAVCLLQDTRTIACGKVQKKSHTKAILKLTYRKKDFVLSEGLEVGIRSGTNRSLGSLPGDTQLSVKQPSPAMAGDKYDVSLGAVLGFTYLYPALTFQIRLARNFTLGLEPIWIGVATNGTSLSAFGGMVSGNYYFSQAFDGFHAQLAAGFLTMSLSNAAGTVSESLSPILVSASLQYRFSIATGIDLGGGAGLLYVLGEPTNFAIGYTGLLPMFRSYLAYSF